MAKVFPHSTIINHNLDSAVHAQVLSVGDIDFDLKPATKVSTEDRTVAPSSSGTRAVPPSPNVVIVLNTAANTAISAMPARFRELIFSSAGQAIAKIGQRIASEHSIYNYHQRELREFQTKHQHMKEFAKTLTKLKEVHLIEYQAMADNYEPLNETADKIEAELLEKYLDCRKKYAELALMKKKLIDIYHAFAKDKKIDKDKQKVEVGSDPAVDAKNDKIKILLGLTIKTALLPEDKARIRMAIKETMDAAREAMVLCYKISCYSSPNNKSAVSKGEPPAKNSKIESLRLVALNQFNILYCTAPEFLSPLYAYERAITAANSSKKGCCTIL